MRILVVHNFYQQPGGEDYVFAAETALLEEHGHEVIRYTAHNDDLRNMRAIDQAQRMLWNQHTWDELSALIERTRPDIAHFHNTFVLISPAAYDACVRAGVPVVQTLHNYRLICANALLLRNQQPCHRCLGKTPPWPGVWHACYRGSHLQSAGLVAMLTAHRWRGTWQSQVSRYIALSEFAREQFIAGGLPAAKIAVKPNFVMPDPGCKTQTGDYALFVGRLSTEKGVETLLEAWTSAGARKVPLYIVGDGPLMETVQRTVTENQLSEVAILGRVAHHEVVELLHRARLLVFPSICYENFSLVLVEAFACGVPVVGSGLGSTSEIIAHGHTGLLFASGDAQDLAAKVTWLWERPARAAQMGRAARAVFETDYSAESNYKLLCQIYDQAI